MLREVMRLGDLRGPTFDLIGDAAFADRIRLSNFKERYKWHNPTWFVLGKLCVFRRDT